MKIGLDIEDTYLNNVINNFIQIKIAANPAALDRDSTFIQKQLNYEKIINKHGVIVHKMLYIVKQVLMHCILVQKYDIS